jgi:hypothetical protein
LRELVCRVDDGVADAGPGADQVGVGDNLVEPGRRSLIVLLRPLDVARRPTYFCRRYGRLFRCSFVVAHRTFPGS